MSYDCLVPIMDGVVIRASADRSDEDALGAVLAEPYSMVHYSSV